MSGHHLQVTLLGSPTVVVNGRLATGFVSSKAQALVYYLAATSQTHSRDTLAGLLWSEVSDERSRKNLRDVLSNLRHLLPDHLDISRQTVGFSETADLYTDTTTFTNLVSHIPATLNPTLANQLRTATNLYKGEFLAGFYIPEAPLFEEWVLGERERLRQLALQTLHTLADYYSQQAEYSQGITCVTRLLVMDPWREESHRQLMQLLALSGQRSAALAQYERCRRVLDEEMGITPSAETLVLYQRILDGTLEEPESKRADSVPSPVSSLPAHNLPSALTPLIGREQETTQLLARLRDPTCRLLTLVGAGGVGKTRLALEVAHGVLPLFAQGVYFVSLVGSETADWPTSDLYPLVSHIATAVKLLFSGPDTAQKQLTNYLRHKQLLLILDNFEQWVTAANFLVELLQEAPGLKLLITSRVRVNVRGEQVMPLAGLPYPTQETADWRQFSSIQLFQHRAQAVQPGFTLQEPDAAAIARICQLVDGLPLGIELAASWARLLPCQGIAHEIEQNLNFLQSNQRDMPQRHQSLRAVFDYSWHLLTEADRRALRQLAVFYGGFSRDAATRIAGASLPVLAALVDNSLLRRAAPDRYELQDVLRQYAAEKLTAATDVTEIALRDRHSYYYLTFLQQPQPDLQGGQQMEALAAIAQEMENIRAAWNWAILQGDATTLQHAADTLALFFYMQSRSQEAEAMFAQAAGRLAELAYDRSAYVTWGKCLCWQGWFTSLLTRQPTAQALLKQSVEILRQHGSPTDLIFPLNFLAAVTSQLGDYSQAQQLCQEALVVSRATANRYGVAISKNILSQVMYALGQYQEAQRYCQESLAIEREIGNRWSMAFSLTNLGRVAFALRDYRGAQARYQESLVIREAMADARGTAVCLNDLGDTADALADGGTAQNYYQASLKISQEIGNPWGIAASLTRLGHLALARGEREIAHSHFYQALRVAHESYAIPRLLEALVGIASLMAIQEMGQAYRLCAFVQMHPAASKDSQDRAALLLKMMPTAVYESFPPETTLAEVVEPFL